MLLLSCSLIVWHVWRYGPAGHAPGSDQTLPFPLQLLNEFRNLLFDRHGVFAELIDILPYFLIGILIAGWLRTAKTALRLQASLRKYGAASVVLASCIGMISPLCACGTITTAVGLLFAGLPLAPVMALLVTSPLLSPSTYLLTLNDLGPEWTVIRTFAAFSMGMIAGFTTLYLCRRGFDKDGLFLEGAVIRGDLHDEDYPDERLKCDCRQRFGNRVALRTGNTFLIFLAKSAEMFWAVGKYVLVGVLLGAIVERYLPYTWIYRFFGGNDPWNILWVTLGAVPLFLHQISASSLLAHIRNSLPGTLDGGVALAFLIGGPVTAMPTMILFWTMFKKRVFVLYLVVCLAGTLTVSFICSLLFFQPGVDLGNALFRSVSQLTGGLSAGIAKKDQLTRIALESHNTPVIAMRVNDLEGEGGLILDGSFSRLMVGLPDTDNRRYVENIAAWLSESSSTSRSSAATITLCLVQSSTGVTPPLAAELAAKLRDSGYSVRLMERRSAGGMTETALDGQRQLWLLFDANGAEQGFTPRELKVLSDFSSSGGGMLIAVNGSGGASALANQVVGLYGLSFTPAITTTPVIRTARTGDLLAPLSGLIGKILKPFGKA